MAIRNFQYSATAPLATTDRVCVIPTGSDPVQRMGIQVTNSGANALDAFQVNVRCGSSTAWTTIASIAGDFSSPVAPLIRTQGAPVSLAAAATCFILLDCFGIHEVELKASAAVGATTLRIDVTLG